MKQYYYLLLLIAVCCFSACQRSEIVSTESMHSATTSTLSSENHGETISLSIEGERPSLTQSLGDEGRSLSFGYTSGNGKVLLRLDDKTEYNVLLIVRPVGGTQYVYAVHKWRHKAGSRRIYLRETQITLPAGVSYGAHAWEAMLLTVPDDFTEQKLKLLGYQLPYSSLIAGNGMVDLSQDRQILMDIPFASQWTPLKKQQHEVYGDELSSHLFVLRPLGALVKYSVHNSMNSPISLTGLKVVSNAIVPSAKLNLSGAALGRQPASSRSLSFSDYGYTYQDREFTYPLNIKNLAKGQTAKEGYIVWYPTTDAVSRRSFDYNDGTPETDLRAIIQHPEFFLSNDYEAASRYATTHVYALGGTMNGRPITKPNLDIVPIMGTDRQLSDGKYYRMNCEVYEQPALQLGYFAKSPLEIQSARDGSSHFVLANPRTLTNDNLPLLSLYQLSNYVDYTSSAPHMKAPISIGGQNYYLPDNAMMRASGLLSTNVVFFKDRIYGGESGGLPSVYWGRGVYKPRKMCYIKPDGKISEGEDCAIVSYSDPDTRSGTCLMYRSAKLATLEGRPVYNSNQAVYRIQAKIDQSRGYYYVSSISVRAVYLGKYYVGDVKPFVGSAFWSTSTPTTHLLNSVERTFYVGGRRVQYIQDGQLTNTFYERDAVGELCAYWAIDAYQMQEDELGHRNASPIIGAWGFYGSEALEGTATEKYNKIWGHWTYRVAHPYSTTYQGD